MLTDSERNFLGALLDSEGPGAAEACASAYRKLTDGNLFSGACAVVAPVRTQGG